MTDIILSTQNGEPVASSRQIAESFEKNHRDVLRAVDGLKEDVRNFAQMFLEENEPDSAQQHQNTGILRLQDNSIDICHLKIDYLLIPPIRRDHDGH